MDTTPDNKAFKHYSTKHRVVTWISLTFFRNNEYRVRGGLLKGLRRVGGLGFLPEFLRRGTSAEEQFWTTVEMSGKTVYDVGAFEGLLTVFFASRAKYVYSFEPNPASAERLLRNVSVNGLTNVRLVPLGIAMSAGRLLFRADPMMAGGNSADAAATGVGGTLTAGDEYVVELEVAPLDHIVANLQLQPPDLIKIDVEGLEAEVLGSARATLSSHRPLVYVELHGDTVSLKRQKTKKVIEILCELGYPRILHLESGQLVGPTDAERLYEGHLIAHHRASEIPSGFVKS